MEVLIVSQHVLMQGLPGMKSLIALYILAIRTTDHCQTIGRECRKFTIDNITHCPELKIRYLAMSGLVFELARKPKPWKPKKAVDVKGKGKAKITDHETPVETPTDSDDFSEIEGGGLEMACVKHLKYWDVPSVKMLHKQVRTGKL